jgi:hypothetical protein
MDGTHRKLLIRINADEFLSSGENNSASNTRAAATIENRALVNINRSVKASVSRKIAFTSIIS